MNAFSRAVFLASAASAEQFPAGGTVEIAFAGRSNVGKSSAINALAGRKRLAFVSRTPGRTQAVNFFSVGERARLVDLPGYGYARVPQAMRARWERLIGAYLQNRPGLRGVVVVMDARHPFTALDRQLLAWLPRAPSLLLLTKADKLSQAERQALIARMASELRDADRALLFSSHTREGVEQAREILEEWLGTAGRGGPGSPPRPE